jgi:hypothetical protein
MSLSFRRKQFSAEVEKSNAMPPKKENEEYESDESS